MDQTKDTPQNLIELLRYLRLENIPEEMHKTYIDNYFEERARKKGIPLKGQFELTPFCNLDCKMCYVHLNKEQMENKQLLDPEQWEMLMKQAIDSGMRKAVLTGGECLTYPGFEKLYLYLQSRGIEVQVYTNGILLTKKKIEFFKKNLPARIQISVYGSDESGYEKVTGHQVYRTVINNIELAEQADLPIQIAITPNIYMGKDAEKIIQYMSEKKIPYRINNTIFEPRTETGRNGAGKLDIDTDEYIRLFQMQAQLSGEKLLKVKEEKLPELPKNMGMKKGIRCAAGKSSFHINWEGIMSGCDMLNDRKEEPLRTGFQKAWDMIHKAALEYPMALQCEICEYSKGCICCPAVHQQNGEMKGKCSPVVCERTRKFAAEGLIKLG